MGRRIPPWRWAASAGLLVSFPVGMVSCNPDHALVFVPLVFVGSSACCNVGVGAWGVESHCGGGLGLPWIKLMCDMSMFPAVRPAAVVPPGQLFMCWRVKILEFARPCASGGFCDASGAEAGLAGSLLRRIVV